MKIVLLASTSVVRVGGGARSGVMSRVLMDRVISRAWIGGGRGGVGQVRKMSRMYEAHASANGKEVSSRLESENARTKAAKEQEATTAEPKTFEELGLDETFVRALRSAFPSVERPTDVQAELITEIFSGEKDILLKDDTGTGKTFGMVLGLLNKRRRVVVDETGEKRRVVTALLVVPHRDLAVQVMGWIEMVHGALGGEAPPLASVAQVLLRGGGWDVQRAVDGLRENVPHMVVCTPQALMEVYEKEVGALGLDTLSAVVVDEVDYLVEIDGRKVEKHRGVTRGILEGIYGRRRSMRERGSVLEEESEESEEWRAERDAMEAELPQLILSSATLTVHFRNYLYDHSGWLNPRRLVKIRGHTPRRLIEHSILVVGQHAVTNADGAEHGRLPILAREEMEEAEEREADKQYARTKSPFDTIALQAIAAAVAIDVPAIALLVIPAGAPVQRAVYDLRRLGIDACALDLAREYPRTDTPRLLVSTPATTRGVDVPELSHVFVLGMGEGRAVEGYTHLAGRVGRFGRSGRVISLVSPAESERMGRVLKAIGQRVIRFQLFD